MKRWSMLILISIAALLSPVFTASVSAQGELSISKSAEPNSAEVGDTITYTYTISNSDNAPIANIALVDDKIGSIDLKQTSLGAGENITATATYVVVETDMPGPLVNIANISGTNSDNNSVTASATASVDLNYTASLQLTKTATVVKAAPYQIRPHFNDNGDATTDNLSLQNNKDIKGHHRRFLPAIELPTIAAPHDTIIYTYTITNNGNVITDNLSLQDDKLGAIPLPGISLAPGESVTATDNYTVTINDLPGPIVNIATVTGTDPDGTLISATTDPVSVSLYVNMWELFKAEILKWRGVPGKGISRAPGLQKPFNPNSKAPEHLFNSDNGSQTKTEIPKPNVETAPGLKKHFTPKPQNAEQLRETERVENQGEEQQLQTTSEVQNQSDSGQTPRDDGQDNPSKWRKHMGTDNQTGKQQATDNGHKPDNEKKNNQPKAGK